MRIDKSLLNEMIGLEALIPYHFTDTLPCYLRIRYTKATNLPSLRFAV